MSQKDLALTEAGHDRRLNRLIIALFAIAGAACGTACLFWAPGIFWGIPLLSVVFYAAALPLFLLTLGMTLYNRG